MTPLQIKDYTVANRLFVGTGKYADYGVMAAALDASGCQVVTVAVRRERLIDAAGRSLLDHLDLSRYTVLPNTAGCFTADDAIRVSLLGRDLLEKNGNRGAGWVKLEVLGDKKTLMPDPVGTLAATVELVKEGFTVLAYTSDDPRQAVRLKEAGAAAVMPAGSPIGSGMGILNPSTSSCAWNYSRRATRTTRSSSTPASAPRPTWRSPWNWGRTASCSTPASPTPRTR